MDKKKFVPQRLFKHILKKQIKLDNINIHERALFFLPSCNIFLLGFSFNGLDKKTQKQQRNKTLCFFVLRKSESKMQKQKFMLFVFKEKTKSKMQRNQNLCFLFLKKKPKAKFKKQKYICCVFFFIAVEGKSKKIGN